MVITNPRFIIHSHRSFCQGGLVSVFQLLTSLLKSLVFTPQVTLLIGSGSLTIFPFPTFLTPLLLLPLYLMLTMAPPWTPGTLLLLIAAAPFFQPRLSFSSRCPGHGGQPSLSSPSTWRLGFCPTSSSLPVPFGQVSLCSRHCRDLDLLCVPGSPKTSTTCASGRGSVPLILLLCSPSSSPYTRLPPPLICPSKQPISSFTSPLFRPRMLSLPPIWTSHSRPRKPSVPFMPRDLGQLPAWMVCHTLFGELTRPLLSPTSCVEAGVSLTTIRSLVAFFYSRTRVLAPILVAIVHFLFWTATCASSIAWLWNVCRPLLKPSCVLSRLASCATDIPSTVLWRSIWVIFSVLKGYSECTGLIIVDQDQEKAYDRVHRRWLFAVLRAYAFPRSFINFFRALYHRPAVIYDIGEDSTDLVRPGRGLVQGLASSCFLYNLVYQPFLSAIRSDLVGVVTCPGAPRLTSASYADNSLVFLADSA